MSQGIISLIGLYDFARECSGDATALAGNSTNGRHYARLCSDLVQLIDECQGFYLWGRYDKQKLWTNIYLGKAGFGRTAHLKNRILEELKDERVCLLRVAYSRDKLLEIRSRQHPGMWHSYEKHFKRALLKAGTTHITWVPTGHLSNDDVERIEADLIEAMNPTANIRRPAPPATLQEDTRDIFQRFRSCIHEGRSSKFEVKLVE